MRKIKSILNMLGTLGSYIVSMLFQFVTQSCIIKLLGIEYSGVNGLFTNIITMLSIAELGIGTTIIFKLYKPLAENNKEKIKSWLNFYKQCYFVIALLVTIIGLLLIPFVPVIVGSVSISENIIFLYLIYLADTILSYIMTYKRSLLYADQKNYIINIVHMLYMIFMNITQILVLYFTKNYIIFLCVKILYRIIENVIINLYVDNKYPYILEKSNELPKEEKKDVLVRIRAMFLQKVSFVVNKGIDSVIISLFMNVSMVGYYTNYNLIVTSLCSIIFQILSSITASVGNLLTENNIEKNYSIYKKISMLNSAFTGIIITGFCCVITQFISMWVGEQYLLPWYIVLSFAIYIYSDSIRRAITIFKEAAGICKEDRYMYIIMALLNLIASIFLCELIGLSGVILGTAMSYIFLIFYSYPKYIFKPIFKKRYIYYYLDMIKYIIYMIVSTLIAIFVIKFINVNNYILSFLINGTIAVCINLLTFVVFFFRTEEFHYYTDMFKRLITKLLSKHDNI